MSLLSLPQSHAQSTHALQTLLSMLREAAPCITEPTTLVPWRGSMAIHLVRSLATRPTWVWWLSRLPRWVVMCTALMQGSGSFLPKHVHQLLRGGEQGEEELLLMQGEEGG